MRTVRKGIMLIQVLTTLPVIAVTLTVGYQLTDRAVRFQGQASRRMELHTRMSDIVRRMQEDVGGAIGATVVPGSGDVAARLALEMPLRQPEVPAARRKIEYEVTGNIVRRTDYTQEAPVRCEWALKDTQTRFTLEALDGGSRLVWVTFDSRLPTMKGAPLERRTTAAAALGRGGLP